MTLTVSFLLSRISPRLSRVLVAFIARAADPLACLIIVISPGTLADDLDLASPCRHRERRSKKDRGKREVACPRKEEEKDEEARSREETRANPEKHLATYLPTPLFIGLIAALHTDCVHFKDGLGLSFEKCKRVIIQGNCRLIFIF